MEGVLPHLLLRAIAACEECLCQARGVARRPIQEHGFRWRPSEQIPVISTFEQSIVLNSVRGLATNGHTIMSPRKLVSGGPISPSTSI